ncbi:DUF4387 domain-containing protein [Microvirga antarctica]|uniref:DUF4387 domain-containing protein n=1 Tax=Microvirga antarctica TaxID=2819233 RepID=UPI001B3090F1|nr:DUF4387 domain-containing protein [Microvirga antarctica]
MKLIDLAKVVRSKNAGPLCVTIDIMFADEDSFVMASRSSALTVESVAALYRVSSAAVTIIPFPAAFAVKVVIDRPLVAGSPGDSDVYGAQQHRPLLGVEL